MSPRQDSPCIYVATPCFGGLVTTHYMMSVLALSQHAAENGFAIDVHLLGRDSLVTRSRNTLVADFMTKPAATHLMFIDADIGFDPQHVQRMLDFDQDIVAGMYPAKALRFDQADRLREREPPAQGALQYVGKFSERDTLELRGSFATGTYCGTGFMLMKRDVIARMIAAYPETAYTSDHVYVADGGQHGVLHALFECIIDPETREYLSEDFGFCRRWSAIGGQIWLDIKGALTHTGSYDFVGNPGLRFGGS